MSRNPGWVFVSKCHSINFEGILETNHKHWRLNSQHRAKLIYHVPNLLFWDQVISAFLRGLRENVVNLLNFVDVSATCWVSLDVRTCELFVSFVAIVRVRAIVLTSLFSLFHVTGEFHRFLHRGRASVGFCRGPRVEGNMSRVEGLEGRGSRVEGRGSRVEGRGSRVEVEGKKKIVFVWCISVLSVKSRFSHILGFHLTSGKTKIKTLSFHLHQVEVSFKQISACPSSAW